MNILEPLLDHSNIWELVPLLTAYAETHYRFKYFPFSLYYRREPEIIVDAPYRINPNFPLPLSIIIKDAHKFPITLKSVHCEIKDCDDRTKCVRLDLNKEIVAPMHYEMFDIDVEALYSGVLTINVKVEIINRGKTKLIVNDNYPGLSQDPLKTYKSDDPLPLSNGWYAGDIHCHTDYGGDQVEFGAPLEVYRKSAEAMGLSWVALTDHSYNLDDMPDNYLVDDPKLSKWSSLKEEVRILNERDESVTLIFGEELTCRSSEGKNIHLLVLNNAEFLKGSGDGAQKWLHTRSEFTVQDALSSVRSEAFVAAAHPFIQIPFLERILVNRGPWTEKELTNKQLFALQVINGKWNQEFERGMKYWNRELLSDRTIFILGGNDAHGNLNRFRQVKIPMLMLREHNSHLFGKVTTRLKIDGKPSVDNVISALKRGCCVVSDGPMIELFVQSINEEFQIGDIVEWNDSLCAKFKVHSTPEFGEIHEIKLIYANKRGIQEQKLMFSDPYCEDGEILLKSLQPKWIRLEVVTKDGNEKHYALSNPMWFKDYSNI